MQARSGARGLSQPREAKGIVIDSEAVSSYQIGDRVTHQKMGAGTIIGLEGDKLSIVFDAGGAKKVLASFVSPVDDVPF